MEAAVDIQQRSYRLLRWVGDAIQRGFIRFEGARHHSGGAAAAEAWIAEHYDNLPVDGRPTATTGPALRRFANFFASYLLTSFELREKPGFRRESSDGCYCDLCSHLVATSHLRPKKLRARDKQGAERLKRDYLEQLAREHAVDDQGTQAGALLGDADLSRLSALAAYGHQLLLRCRGQFAGPEVLALWRQFAWRASGSPIPDFELSAEEILKAERRLLGALQAQPERG